MGVDDLLDSVLKDGVPATARVMNRRGKGVVRTVDVHLADGQVFSLTVNAHPALSRPSESRPRYASLGFTDDQVARGEDFGRYDFPNLGSPGPDHDNIREW
jgi:hypothetical protein